MENLVWIPVISFCKIFIPSDVFDGLLCQNWLFSSPNRETLRTTLLGWTFVWTYYWQHPNHVSLNYNYKRTLLGLKDAFVWRQQCCKVVTCYITIFFKIYFILWEYGLSIQAWIFISLKSSVIKVFGKKHPWVLALAHISMVFLQIQIGKGAGPWSTPKYRSILWLKLSSCGHPKVLFFSFSMGNVDLSIVEKFSKALCGPKIDIW